MATQVPKGLRHLANKSENKVKSPFVPVCSTSQPMDMRRHVMRKHPRIQLVSQASTGIIGKLAPTLVLTSASDTIVQTHGLLSYSYLDSGIHAAEKGRIAVNEIT